MTDFARAEILLKALQEAGRYMRKYLPAEMPLGEDTDITRYCLIMVIKTQKVLSL